MDCFYNVQSTMYNENEGLPQPLPEGKGNLKSLPLGGDLEEASNPHNRTTATNIDRKKLLEEVEKQQQDFGTMK